jgi:TPR repeat protein
MASEAQGVTSSPQPYDNRQYHERPPSIDYSTPVSRDPYHQPHHSHRLSTGSVQTARRPVSEPNDLDLAGMRISSMDPPTIGRHQTAPNGYQNRAYPPRQRSVTGDASSVYSLDSGSGYGGQGNQNGPHYGFTNGAPAPPTWDPYPSATPDFSNPYYSAASDFLGLPPGANPPHASSSSQTLPSRHQSTATLARTNTSLTTSSALSSTSSVSLVRAPTESVGALSTRRRGTQAAVDVSKPPYTKQYVDDYRKRMKDDPDPEAQFAFSKYLIEAAKKIGDELASSDPKLGRKYRDVLLQESLRNIKKLAEGKEPYADAQFFLANLYGTGQLGLGVDHEKAYYLYLMALKLNHPAATYRSAVCNEIGAGTKRDPARAVIFYRKAAGLGDTAAMYKLSMIHLGGLLNAPRNPREAVAWLKRAAAQADEDNPHALHELALLHERPPPKDPNAQVVPHDPNAARELFMQAAQLGYAPAQFKLGACHEFGTLGCPIDPRKSIGWYTRSAEKGDSEAELALSGWYLTGSGE